jgi:hypothetical protein
MPAEEPLWTEEPDACAELNHEIATGVLGLTVRVDATGLPVIVGPDTERPLPDYSGRLAVAIQILKVLWDRGYAIYMGGVNAGPEYSWRWVNIARGGTTYRASGPTLALAICRCARKIGINRPCNQDPRWLHPNAKRDGTDQPEALSRGGSA